MCATRVVPIVQHALQHERFKPLRNALEEITRDEPGSLRQSGRGGGGPKPGLAARQIEHGADEARHGAQDVDQQRTRSAADVEDRARGAEVVRRNDILRDVPCDADHRVVEQRGKSRVAAYRLEAAARLAVELGRGLSRFGSNSVSPCQDRVSISPSNSVQSRNEPGAPRDRRRPMSVSRYGGRALADDADGSEGRQQSFDRALGRGAGGSHLGRMLPAPESRASITPRATAEYSTAVMRCPPTRSSRWSFGSGRSEHRALPYRVARRSIVRAISSTRLRCSAIRAESFSGAPPIACCPAAVNFCCTAGSASTAFMSSLMRARSASGIPFHPNSPAPPMNVNSS